MIDPAAEAFLEGFSLIAPVLGRRYATATVPGNVRHLLHLVSGFVPSSLLFPKLHISIKESAYIQKTS